MLRFGQCEPSPAAPPHTVLEKERTDVDYQPANRSHVQAIPSKTTGRALGLTGQTHLWYPKNREDA